jgi:hypothetical protein
MTNGCTKGATSFQNSRALRLYNNGLALLRYHCRNRQPEVG